LTTHDKYSQLYIFLQPLLPPSCGRGSPQACGSRGDDRFEVALPFVMPCAPPPASFSPPRSFLFPQPPIPLGALACTEKKASQRPRQEKRANLGAETALQLHTGVWRMGEGRGGAVGWMRADHLVTLQWRLHRWLLMRRHATRRSRRPHYGSTV